jgi:hypothetical protein
MSSDAQAALQRLHTALGDYDLTAASSALADLDRVGAPGNTGDLVRLRSHIGSYEYEEAQVLVTRMLQPIGGRVS